MEVLAKQYEWIRVTRETLFSYCEALKPEDYVRELDGFGFGSIRNLHVHVSNCYEHWLRGFGLWQEPKYVKPETVQSVEEMRKVFGKVNALAEEFLREYEGKWDTVISRTFEETGEVEELTPLWLLTHTVTHEFHHKGQILSMSRQMGYTPVDSDLISPKDIKETNA